MVTLKKISLPEVVKGVAIAYDKDQDLFDKYHIGKCDFAGAVMSTVAMIREASKERNLSYYKVVYKQTPIGYVVVFPDFLYSYGINPKFRKKEILVDWWGQVRKLLGRNFATQLYPNNTRAADFLVKNGMKAYEQENDTILFVNEK